jgi:glycosyltransferase involved in cell wall biosynthesis
MPSRAEVFGLVGVEAIENGVPVLVSDTSGLGVCLLDQLPRADTSRFVVGTDAHDPEEPWKWQIRQLLLDPSDAFARIEQIRRSLVADRPWARVAAELLAAVDRVPATVPS